MAASLLALVSGITISIIIMQAVIAAQLYVVIFFQKTLAHGVVLQIPFGKQVSVSGKDYLCVAELCVSEL